MNSVLDCCYFGGISLFLLCRLPYAFVFSFSVSNRTLYLMQNYRHVCVRQTDSSLVTRILSFPFNQLPLQCK